MNTMKTAAQPLSEHDVAPISRRAAGPALTRLRAAVRSDQVRRTARLALAALSSVLVFATIAAPGAARAATVPTGDLGPCLCVANRTLQAGQYLLSQNGAYQLAMQTDGNLVVYAGVRPLWDSQTSNNPGAYAVLQATDGNLVVYSPTGKALWSAYVPNSPSDELQMQNDGNLVVYSASGAAQWATMSAVQPRGATLGYNPGASGQCTWWAENRFAAYTGTYINTLGINGTNGNARYWGYNASQRGWSVGSGPRIGSIAVFQPGTFGTGSVGHVAWVTQVYPARNSIVIQEMNYVGAGVVDTRTISPAFGVNGLQYIYTNP